ncbi:Putative Lon protease homolog [Serratia symbiotica]|nr:Putative Lon protease homolog [Serratia symbiotica]
MINNELNWQSLIPNIKPYIKIFDIADQLQSISFSTIQPKLQNALITFCHSKSTLRFMLLKSQDTEEYLSLISRVVKKLFVKNTAFKGSNYIIKDNNIYIETTNCNNLPFSANGYCIFQNWIELEDLFGCVRFYNNKINLQPGLLHKANGGILILSVNSLLAQPLLWFRVKKMIIQGQFYWISQDKSCPLPINIPPMPLELRLIIVGNRDKLADFYNLEPKLNNQSIYGEYEDFLELNEINDMSHWCSYINTFIKEKKLPFLESKAWSILLINAIRYTGDKKILPLSLQWINKQLIEASLYTKKDIITAESLKHSTNLRIWRESYFKECIQNEINWNYIFIKTEGKIIGQINGLSILDYPGYPYSIGVPLRISCVIYFGNSEFIDVERQVELGGNLHAKSIMIIQSFLLSELNLNYALPFSFSIVFEQSYGEVDGDSASLAILCVLISALSQKPISQQIAVTGSIDQFGNVQLIDGINEKIESFFEICLRRGLTGNQGVILPTANVRHLCLNKDIVYAVRNKKFHLWTVNTVSEALKILTGYSYSNKEQPNLLMMIKKRISKINYPEKYYWSWLFRWFN